MFDESDPRLHYGSGRTIIPHTSLELELVSLGSSFPLKHNKDKAGVRQMALFPPFERVVPADCISSAFYFCKWARVERWRCVASKNSQGANSAGPVHQSCSLNFTFIRRLIGWKSGSVYQSFQTLSRAFKIPHRSVGFFFFFVVVATKILSTLNDLLGQTVTKIFVGLWKYFFWPCSSPLLGSWLKRNFRFSVKMSKICCFFYLLLLLLFYLALHSHRSLKTSP